MHRVREGLPNVSKRRSVTQEDLLAAYTEDDLLVGEPTALHDEPQCSRPRGRVGDPRKEVPTKLIGKFPFDVGNGFRLGERVRPRLQQEAPPGRITRTSAKGLTRGENTWDKGQELRYMGSMASRPMVLLHVS